MRFVIRNRKKIEEKLGVKLFSTLLSYVATHLSEVADINDVVVEEEGKTCVFAGEHRFVFVGKTWDVVRLAYFPKTDKR